MGSLKVGETVTLKVLNPLWARKASYAYPIEQYQTYTGEVLPSPRWVGDDRLCLSTGRVDYPFRVIEKCRIVGSNTTSAPLAPERAVFTVAGVKAGSTYIVTREGSRWACNCTGFGYRRTCSHVEIAKNGGNPLKSRGNTPAPAKSLISQGQKKLKKSQKSALLIFETSVDSKSRLNETGRTASNLKMENSMSKVYSGTNRAKVVAIMNDNANLDREACITLIAKLGEMPYETAKAGYQRAVRLGLASGQAKASVKAPKAKKPKDIHAASNKLIAKVVKATEKSSVEVADIKAKNLAKLREVSKKYSQVARPEGAGVPNFDAKKAKKQVREFNEGNDEALWGDAQLDSFKSPSKLTRDEVKYLV